MFSKRSTRDKLHSSVMMQKMLNTTESSSVSSFSKKMMEKMGWKDGDGLGVDRQGIAEPIKIKPNFFQKGFGFSSQNGTQQVEQAVRFEKFQSVLSALKPVSARKNDETEEDNLKGAARDDEQKDKSVKQSLVATSDKSSRRIHYKKYTKGKDLSFRSSEEIACVLGSKAHNLYSSLKASEAEEDEQDQKFKFSYQNSSEYFANAMKGSNSDSTSSSDRGEEEREETEDEDTGRPAFGFGFKTDDEQDKGNSRMGNFEFGGVYDPSTEQPEVTEEKEDKILQKCLQDRYETNYRNAFVSVAEVNSEDTNSDAINHNISKNKKKKKKSKNQIVNIENATEINLAKTPGAYDAEKSETETKEISVKETATNNNDGDVILKKNKKKSKKTSVSSENLLSNSNNSENSYEIKDGNLDNNSKMASKKRKKSKLKLDEVSTLDQSEFCEIIGKVDNIIFQREVLCNGSNASEPPRKKRKKENKSKANHPSSETPATEINLYTTPTETRNKKPKRK